MEKENELYDLAPLATQQGISLEDFIRAMAKILDLKLTFDPKSLTARKVVIIGDTSKLRKMPDGTMKAGFWVHKRALRGVFFAVLRLNNLGLDKILEKRGEYDIELSELVASAKLKEGNTIVVIGDDINAIPEGVEFVTMVMHVKYADPNLVFRAITNLLSRPDGFAQPITGVNSILISDYANNIRRMAEIIRLIDKEPAGKVIRYIRPKHRYVEDLLEPLQRLLGLRVGAGGQPVPAGATGPDGRLLSADDQIELEIDPPTNTVIVRATEDNVKKVQDLVDALDLEVPTPDEPRVHVYFAKNVDATELATTLNDVISGVQSTAQQQQGVTPTPGGGQPGGAVGPGSASSASAGALAVEAVSVIADAVTNSLVITATPARYRDILEIVKKLDIRKPQVLIEASIIEVLSTDDLTLGIELATLDEPSERARGFAATSFGLSQLVDASGNPTSAGGTPAGRAPNQSQGITAGVFKDTFFNIPILLQAKRDDSFTNVVSVPRVLTDSGESATIEIASEVPVREFIAASGGSPQQENIKFEDAPIRLTVRPLVSEENLRLELQIEVTNFVGAGGGGLPPAKNTRTTEQVITVPNNRLVILGGLTSAREIEQISKVPLLAEIPLLGELFKYRTNQTERRNLYIFLTPRILRETTDVFAATKEQTDDLRDKSNTLAREAEEAIRDDAPEPYFRRRGKVPHQRFDYSGDGASRK